jgi:hypothetical protein
MLSSPDYAISRHDTETRIAAHDVVTHHFQFLCQSSLRLGIRIGYVI